jgi:polysaccharide pyruvyl transferase WcaK-like protein
MRLHAAMAAVVAARPTVLIGYTDKVNALATELGGTHGAATHVTDDPTGWQTLGEAAATVAGHSSDMAAAQRRLAANLWVHDTALDTLWRTPPPQRGSLHGQ